MAALDPKLFQSTLADTIAWCKRKATTMDVESDEVRRRQSSYSLAEQRCEQLWKEAIEIRARDGLRSVAGIGQYQNALALLEEIRDLLGPMDSILRSPELKPSFSLDRIGADSLWIEAVEEVVTLRAGFVAENFDEQFVRNTGGRFLLYRPSDNLACGAAEVSSNGFFDPNNIPPWDLWLGFSGGTLVSWIPPAFVDVAAVGIFANPEECIKWADFRSS